MTIEEIKKNLKKDFLIELRNRSALTISLSFAAVSVIAIGLASRGSGFTAAVHSVLVWVLLFFCAMNSISHIFIREDEESTSNFLRLSASSESIFLSKLIFNIILFLFIEIILLLFYIFFLQPQIFSSAQFSLTALTGGIALSSSTTILGAMVSGARMRGPLFTVISLPVILPVLWISIDSTEKSMTAPEGLSYGNIIFLVAFSLAFSLISLILFRHVWTEK